MSIEYKNIIEVIVEIKPLLIPIGMALAAYIAAKTATSNNEKTHLLEKKRDVILEITSELADLRNYVIRKSITKHAENSDKKLVMLELQQLVERLVPAIDKFYVISSDESCSKLENKQLLLLEFMNKGIQYHFNSKITIEDVIKSDYLANGDNLRVDIIEILNNELNNKKVSLIKLKEVIKFKQKLAQKSMLETLSKTL